MKPAYQFLRCVMPALSLIALSGCEKPKESPPEPPIFLSGESFHFTLGNGESEASVDVKVKYFNGKLHHIVKIKPKNKTLDFQKFKALLLKKQDNTLSVNFGDRLNKLSMSFADSDGFVVSESPILDKYNTPTTAQDDKGNPMLDFSGSSAMEKDLAARIEGCSLTMGFTEELSELLKEE
jgi:hypothetical protein